MNQIDPEYNIDIQKLIRLFPFISYIPSSFIMDSPFPFVMHSIVLLLLLSPPLCIYALSASSLPNINAYIFPVRIVLLLLMQLKALSKCRIPRILFLYLPFCLLFIPWIITLDIVQSKPALVFLWKIVLWDGRTIPGMESLLFVFLRLLSGFWPIFILCIISTPVQVQNQDFSNAFCVLLNILGIIGGIVWMKREAWFVNFTLLQFDWLSTISPGIGMISLLGTLILGQNSLVFIVKKYRKK